MNPKSILFSNPFIWHSPMRELIIFSIRLGLWGSNSILFEKLYRNFSSAQLMKSKYVMDVPFIIWETATKLSCPHSLLYQGCYYHKSDMLSMSYFLFYKYPWLSVRLSAGIWGNCKNIPSYLSHLSYPIWIESSKILLCLHETFSVAELSSYFTEQLKRTGSLWDTRTSLNLVIILFLNSR